MAAFFVRVGQGPMVRCAKKADYAASIAPVVVRQSRPRLAFPNMNSLSDFQPGQARNDSGALAQCHSAPFAALPNKGHARRPGETSGLVPARHALSPLTFGGCIASACTAFGTNYAEGLLRFAVNSGIVNFPGQRCVEIGPHDPHEQGTTQRHEATGFFQYFLQDDRQHRPAAILGGAGAPSVSARLARARGAVSDA